LMLIRISVLLAASFFVAQPTLASVIAVHETTLEESRKWSRENRREWLPLCRKVWANRRNLDTILSDKAFYPERLKNLSERFRYGEYGCRRDLPLAIKLMERIAGIDPLSADQNYVRQLIELLDTSKVPDSFARAQELKRLQWVRGSFYGREAELGWTESERMTFVARGDIWAHLMAQGPEVQWAKSRVAEGLLNPASPRRDPANGISFVENRGKSHLGASHVTSAARYLIEGKSVAKDWARAEALLGPVALGDESAKAMILPLIAPRMDSPESSVRDAAAATLFKLLRNGWAYGQRPSATDDAVRTILVPYYAARLSNADSTDVEDAVSKLTDFAVSKNETAVPPLITWLDKRLRVIKMEDRIPAWDALARLIRADNADARKLLDADMKRTAGIVDVGLLKTENHIAGSISDDDYPPSAQRNEEDGVVSVTLLIAPNGRGIAAFVTKGATPTLDAEVAKLMARRFRFEFPNHRGRYVRVQMPDVQFRLPECSGGRESDPAIPGAIVVTARCRRERIS
jgi:TonB family protein